MTDIAKAIKAINSEAAFYITSENIDTIQWLNGTAVIPKSDIQAKQVELQAEYDALQYQRDREPDYPNLAEQFDLLWHAIDSDTLDKTSDFYTTLKAVKDAHPKG